MYERILVPLDSSKIAETALPYAQKIARRIGSQITLISVLSDDDSDEGRYHRLHQSYIQALVKAGRLKAIKIESVILSGNPAEEIVDYAEKNNVGLIVMGTRGLSALKRWILGSVADKVVSDTKLPVAFITTEDIEIRVPREDILRRALVILDGTPEGEAVIPYVDELASKLDIDVTLLHLVDKTSMYYDGADDYSYVPVSEREMNSIRAKARRYLKKLALPLESNGITVSVKVMTKGKSAETVIKAAGRIDADLVAMSTRGRSGLGRWFFNSVRDEVVNAGDMLVLLINQPE